MFRDSGLDLVPQVHPIVGYPTSCRGAFKTSRSATGKSILKPDVSGPHRTFGE
jgi:hypothetical protein